MVLVLALVMDVNTHALGLVKMDVKVANTLVLALVKTDAREFPDKINNVKNQKQ